MINKFCSLNKMNTIKSKMIFYYMMMIIFISILSIYSLSITNRYKEQIDSMFVRNLILKDISEQISIVDKELVVFLSTKNSTSLNNYMRYADELEKTATKISEQVVSFSEEEIMLIDIKNMINSFIIQTQKAVSEKRKTDVIAYTNTYNNVLTIKSYIMEYISELNNRQLYKNSANYTYMSKQIKTSSILNVIMIVDLLLLSIIIVYTMTNSMIKPLTKLSHSAEDISRGKFDTDEITVNTNDEIEILAMAFNKMKISIHTYIEELKEKALTEAKLKDQQMENLKMQNLLDNARLYALQSQMNPHFLFNTINAGVQLSMLEGADKTSMFLESMSRVFRYNIKQIDSEVTISQEIDNVKDYYDLLKVRFGDLISFEFEIDEACIHFQMPPLILQPIVENAYIHGLSKKEEGGTIKIKVFDNNSTTKIVIEDDGVGMSQEIINKIFNLEATVFINENSITKSNKSPGIGMKNVIDRLELFFKQENLITIESIENIGTQVIISIPHDKGEKV